MKRHTIKKPDEKNITLNGHTLTLTHLNKIYWPNEKYTKGDLIDYYLSVAPFILSYLKNRPQVLHRYPNGIKGKSFFQKNIVNLPDWIKTQNFYSESSQRNVHYLICDNKSSLIYMVNLGCIELHPWTAKAKSPDHPDFCILDLDPEDIAFKAVVKTAQKIHQVLDDIGAANYCKTSGATGLHVCIPLGGKYTFEQSRQFAQLIATIVNTQLPDITSIERLPKNRQKKVYIDYLQNRHNQTIAAPYTVRPRSKAPVSTPLLWEEVNEKLAPQQFTIHTILPRLNKIDDIWKPVLGKGINLSDCIRKLEKIW